MADPLRPVSEVIVFGREYAIVIDGSWIEPDGGLALVLDKYENAGSGGSPVCYSEADVKAALLRHGVYEDQAAESARLIWANKDSR